MSGTITKPRPRRGADLQRDPGHGRQPAAADVTEDAGIPIRAAPGSPRAAPPRPANQTGKAAGQRTSTRDCPTTAAAAAPIAEGARGSPGARARPMRVQLAPTSPAGVQRDGRHRGAGPGGEGHAPRSAGARRDRRQPEDQHQPGRTKPSPPMTARAGPRSRQAQKMASWVEAGPAGGCKRRSRSRTLPGAQPDGCRWLQRSTQERDIGAGGPPKPMQPIRPHSRGIQPDRAAPRAARPPRRSSHPHGLRCWCLGRQAAGGGASCFGRRHAPHAGAIVAQAPPALAQTQPGPIARGARVGLGPCPRAQT